jgi:propionyl-CoA carboxylase beta chain
MGSKHLGADVNVAWPTAQIAVTGAAGAVSILYRKELAGLSGDELAARRADLQQEYEDTLANPYIAADRGYIDGVIPPSHTRGYVARSLRLLATKREAVPARKHGNIPL